MKLYCGDRQSGKTSLLIRKSIETGAHIVAHNKNASLMIYKLAKQLYPDKILTDVYILNINNLSNPILSVCLRNGTIHSNDKITNEQLLIDDYEVFCKTLMDRVLEHNTIIGATASINEQNWEMEYINKDTK